MLYQTAGANSRFCVVVELNKPWEGLRSRTQFRYRSTQRKCRRYFLGLLGFILLFFFAQFLWAQATSGSILGVVTDPSGAVVPQTSVEATNEATGLNWKTRSSGVGIYSFPSLPPGTYLLTLRKAGFKTISENGIELRVDDKLQINFRLAVGQATQKVRVSGAAPILEAQSPATGEVIQSRQILDLPLLGRNFLDLAKLTAGVYNGSGGNNVNLAVNGQREFANSIMVDGVEVTTNRNNDTGVRPSLESVQEFKVLTSAYAPEFGGASGAAIAIQTKSGTNHLHGDLYEFLRPNNTTARTFFSPDTSALKQNDFGGTLGGPIKRDRTFYFGSYEGERLRNVYSYLDSVPPKNQIVFLPDGSVDLSGLKDPFTGNSIPIFDPNFYATNYYSQQFSGNIIPANRVSPAGRAILQDFFPAPTQPGIDNGWFNNFVSRQTYAYNANTIDGRIDHSLSEIDRLSGVYHYNGYNSLLGDRFAGHIPVQGGGDADTGDQETSRSQSLSVTETHVLSNQAINEFRFGYTRFRLNQFSLLNGRDLATQFGVGNVNLPGFPQTLGFPYVFLGAGYETGGSTYKPLTFLDSNLQFTDNITAHYGHHGIKVGLDFRHLDSNPDFSLFPTGFQYYGGPYSSLTSDPNYSFYDPNAFYGNGGSDIADLLLGLPLTVTEGLQLANPKTMSHELGLYAQDSWQATRRLVFVYGIRYEYQSPYTEANNQASNFNLATDQILLAGRGGNSAGLVRPDRNNVAPRFGFAYQLTRKTVVRGGYGFYYSPENDARSDVLTKNYPYAVEQTFYNNIYGGLPFTYELDTGVPRITSIPIAQGTSSLSPADIQSATGTAQNVFAVDPNFQIGYSQLYNFTVERELTPTLTLQAGYVGSVSRKLSYAVGNLNVANRVSDQIGQVQALFSEGSASFNSLQVKARKRFSRHLSFLVAYTYAKNMDNGPGPFNLGHNLNSNNQPQDPFNLSLEHAVADDDVTHNLVASYIYELPFGRGQRFFPNLKGLSQKVWGGWQMNGIFTARSGLPLNVVRNSEDTGYQGLRPDLLHNPNMPGPDRTLAHYFDTSAFDVSPFTGANSHALGNAGRNMVRGPGFANLDFSMIKNTAINERVSLQLRFEFFNLTNTPHFANPNGDMASGNFGTITQTIGNPRIIQFAAKIHF